MCKDRIAGGFVIPIQRLNEVGEYMKIVHFSDVHIGVENYGRIDPSTGLSARLGDFLATFDEVVDYAISERADLALFAGDAYKSRNPSQTHQREFASRIARLADAGVPAFLVVGNHDMPLTAGPATALEIFDTLGVRMVHVGERLGTHVVETPAGPVQIVSVPWIRRSQFLASEERSGLTIDQTNALIQDRLTEGIRTLAERLDPTLPAVLAAHVTVSSAVVGGSSGDSVRHGSERSMMLGRDHVLLRSSLARPQFDYVALGHIHKHQVVGESPKMAYAGSLERVDFGEEGDDKGFCVVELDAALPPGSRLKSFRFQKVNARRFVTIDVKLRPGDQDPTATVLKEIERQHVEGAIVKLKIAYPLELQGHLGDAEIRRALDGAFYVASVSKQPIEQPKNRLGDAYSKGTTPQELLRLYLDSKGVAKDRSAILMGRAEELLVEEV